MRVLYELLNRLGCLLKFWWMNRLSSSLNYTVDLRGDTHIQLKEGGLTRAYKTPYGLALTYRYSVAREMRSVRQMSAIELVLSS